MPRLFLDQTCAVGDHLHLRGDDAHYLTHVLRLGAGDHFTAVLPDGREASVVIRRAGTYVEGEVHFLAAPRPAPAVPLVLYAALLKHAAWEWLLQKTTEIGVAEIIPVLTERTVVRLREDRLPHQTARWREITAAAARQCGAPALPVLRDPLPFPAALRDWQERGAPGLFFALPARGEPAAGLRSLLAAMESPPALALFLGPEGDFSPAEVDAALAAGLPLASLGDRVLRAETAALVAAALCLFELSSPA